MLSIKYIRENLEKVQKYIINKKTKIDLSKVLDLDVEKKDKQPK